MDPDTAERLRRVVVKLARYLNADATAEGLTPTQASVLGIVVAARRPVGLADILDAESLNSTMLSRVLSKLEGAGLVARGSSSGDQRVVSVTATEAGRRVHERLKNERAASVARLLADLDPESEQLLEDGLDAWEQLAEAARSWRRPG